MAMNPIQVTPDVLHKAGKDCTDMAGLIDGKLAALKSYVGMLEGQWHGMAADQWTSLMTDFDIYARMLHDALTDIGLGLEGNGLNYVDGEMANINSLVGVNGDIPGARL